MAETVEEDVEQDNAKPKRSAWWILTAVVILIVVVELLLLVFRSCTSRPATVAEGPTIVISAPANNSVHTVGESIEIRAEAHDPAGTVSSVEIRVDDSPLDTLRSAPYTANWTPFGTGDYKIRAVAKDIAGGTAESAAVVVNVKSSTLGTTTLLIDKSAIPQASWMFFPVTGFWGVYGTASPKSPSIVSGAQRLKSAFFPATVIYTSEWTNLSPGGNYIVFIGPYKNQALAQQALTVARAGGFKGMYVQWSGPHR